jgi:hypothetical protein
MRLAEPSPSPLRSVSSRSISRRMLSISAATLCFAALEKCKAQSTADARRHGV